MKIVKTFILQVAAVALLNSVSVFGQGSILPAERIKNLHHETIGDSYLPNAHQNKKVSPAYKYRRAAAPAGTGSSIFTIQVNVDGSGQNIIDDAANEPSLAVNPADGNSMVIGWRQFDNIFSNFRQAGWAYTTDAGQSWTFPGVIEPGIFRSDPVLDFDAYGNFYYNSLTNTPTYVCKVFESANGGASWNGGTDAQGGDKQWMAIDRTTGTPQFNIYSFWSLNYSSCSPGHFTRSIDSGNSYSQCDYIPGEPALGTMVVNQAGELYVAGVSSLTDSLVVVRSLNAQSTGSSPQWEPYVGVFMDGTLNGWTTVNPTGLFGQVNIDVDRNNGNVYLLSSILRYSNQDPGDIMFARSADGGLTWSPPVRINDDISTTNTQWFGTMSVAPDGRIDVVWLDTREDISNLDSSALYYSYSTDHGVTWSANEKMSALFDPHVGYPNQMKMGDYFDMESDSAGAHLAWANTFNAEQDVYYSRIIPQIPVGAVETSAGTTFSIYPNPTTGKFVISIQAGKMLPNALRMEIFNMMGEKVYSAAIAKTKSELDISMLPAGIYFLKMINSDGSGVVRKIVRQ